MDYKKELEEKSLTREQLSKQVMVFKEANEKYISLYNAIKICKSLAKPEGKEEIDAWSLTDIISKLCEATEILLHKKDYDGHGYEEMQLCLERGRKYVAESYRIKTDKQSLTTRGPVKPENEV